MKKRPFAVVWLWFNNTSKGAVTQGPAAAGGRHHCQALRGMQERAEFLEPDMSWCNGKGSPTGQSSQRHTDTARPRVQPGQRGGKKYTCLSLSGLQAAAGTPSDEEPLMMVTGLLGAEQDREGRE